MSLRACGGSGYEHFVGCDFPPRRFFSRRGKMSEPSSRRATQKIYSGCSLIEQKANRGSAGALLTTVQAAINRGFRYGYIHLDDHVYVPQLATLLEHAIDAFSSNPDLVWLRFSDYPLISGDGSSFVTRDRVISFDRIALAPTPMQNYTLWLKPLAVTDVQGNYWPVAMWHAIYRLPLLQQLLQHATNEISAWHLCDVESYYKGQEGWDFAVQKACGMSYGYINMQFAGFEMHRNKNYRELLAMPNNPVV